MINEEKCKICISEEELFVRANELHRFTSIFADHDNWKKDYGNGQMATAVEAHLMYAIHERPGINVTELAKYWNRTKGAVSQVISKLELKGMIRKENSEKNKKNIQLYLTEEGEKFHHQHMRFDEDEMGRLVRELSPTCTEEEIEAFFKVVNGLTEIVCR